MIQPPRRRILSIWEQVTNLLQDKRLRLVLAFFPVAAITLAVLIIRPDLSQFSSLGYVGVTVLMFISSATVLLPMPGLATVAIAGSLWNPLLVGLAGGLGGSAGELMGYLAGRGVSDYVEDSEPPWMLKVRDFVTRHGFFAILLFSSVPNPVFDVIGLAAGSCGFPAWRFYLAVLIGNTIKCVTIAMLGETASAWFAQR